jgi:phosphoglycerol transferase MdoB-like AlkP superfamily enzyme
MILQIERNSIKRMLTSWLVRLFGETSLGTLLLFLVVIVSIVDLTLMEVSRQTFRGGFLQSHKISGTRTALFLGEFFTLGICFYGFLLALCAAVAVRCRVRRIMVAYHFFAVAGLGSLIHISIRYQLAQYFSDFVSFSVVKNLGGGSLLEALQYGLREGMIFAGFAAIILLMYIAGHFLLSSSKNKVDSVSLRRSLYYLSWMASASIGTITIVLLVNSDDDFRYNVNYTTAYPSSRKVLDVLTDFDRDGYGFFSWRRDPAPFNASIYPGALDIPDDGIDQDGLFGDFHFEARSLPTYQFASVRKNVVLIVVESARADALNSDVEGQPVMPNMQSLAKEGGAAREYFSHTGYTTSSLKALFSGGIEQAGFADRSLFSVFKRAGYQVGVFSGQPEAFGGISEASGSKDLADVYFDAEAAANDRVFASASHGSLTLSNDRVVSQFTQDSSRFDWSRPVLLYFNLQSGHFPYYYDGMPQIIQGAPIPRNKISFENRAWLRRTYFNAIAYADRSIGEIVESLKQLGVYNDTIVVVTGDHGESLFDDNFLGHGHYLNDVQMKTVLVSNRALPEMGQLLGQADIMPMLVNAAGGTVVGSGMHRIEPYGVFQYIGPLQTPEAIGFVRPGGVRVTLNMSNEEAYFSKESSWLPRSVWEADATLKQEIERLVVNWETHRWQAHAIEREK